MHHRETLGPRAPLPLSPPFLAAVTAARLGASPKACGKAGHDVRQARPGWPDAEKPGFPGARRTAGQGAALD